MAATTQARDTKQYGIDPIAQQLSVPMKANTKVNKGSLVVADLGLAAPGRTATALVALGRAENDVDNTGGAASAKSVTVRRGTFKWANSSAGDLIAQTELGKTVYIVDDQTVAKTDGTGTRSIAGKCLGVDSSGVWVETL